MGVMDIRIAPESGWRALEQAVINECTKNVLEDFGCTISVGVRLLCQDDTGETLAQGASGKCVIYAGQSTLAALQQLKLSYCCTGVDRAGFARTVGERPR